MTCACRSLPATSTLRAPLASLSLSRPPCTQLWAGLGVTRGKHLASSCFHTVFVRVFRTTFVSSACKNLLDGAEIHGVAARSLNQGSVRLHGDLQGPRE